MIKKSITINLCGRLFAIDEDACERLEHYTETIRRYYTKEGSPEVADDIESRIAELFEERVAQGASAITMEVTIAVINQIGNLDELAPGEEKGGTTTADRTQTESRTDSGSTVSHKSIKRLYRDLEHNVLCGVCAGFEQYFHIGANWFRAGFLIFLFLPLILSLLISGPTGLLFSFISFFTAFSVFNLTPIFLYILCAFIMPPAKEPEDRLRMRGVEVNPQNIATEIARKPNLGNGKIFSSFFHLLYRVIAFLVGAAALIAGVVFSFFLASDNVNVFGMQYTRKTDELSMALADATKFELHLMVVSFYLFIIVLVYCCFHAMTKGYGQRKSMTGMQRLTWISVMILAAGSLVFAGIRGDNKQNNIRNEYLQKEREAHMIDGFYFNDTDRSFFQRGRWNLIMAKNLTDERYTYAGEYYDGDPNERYLDAYSYNKNLLYRVERTDSVAAGSYELQCYGRASSKATGAFIYLIVEKDGVEQQYLSEIPGYGHLSVDNLPHGWCRIAIPFDVPVDAKVRYGITTDKSQTGKYCNAEYVSATDFYIVKQL